MIMEMFIITLVNRFLYRRPYDPLPSESDDNDENTKIDFHAAIAEEDVWKEEDENPPQKNKNQSKLWWTYSLPDFDRQLYFMWRN